ncbi:MAG TPA: phosphatase PAP2 family protein [Candidatus Saccharimonadales bacterium]
MTTKKKNEATPYGHRNWYVGAFVLAVLLLAVSAYMAHHHTITGVELKTFRHINDWPDKFTTFFKIASIAPESITFGAAAVVLAFVFRYYRLSWRLAVETVVGYGAAEFLKIAIARPRPFSILASVHKRWTDTGNGFPSGHAMMITVIMLTVLPYLPRRWRWIVPVPIILVGLSRVYLGLHAPLDIVGGFAVGLGVVSFVRILPQSLKVALRLD